MNMAILTLADVVHEPTIDEVLDAVCAEFKLPVAYLQGPMRWKEYVRARHVFCYIARIYGQEKWVSIAHALKRDHCTAHNSMNRVKANLAKFEPQLSRIVNRLYKNKGAA